jgi:hypothetical protein
LIVLSARAVPRVRPAVRITVADFSRPQGRQTGTGTV